jgi:hypothetical protein
MRCVRRSLTLTLALALGCSSRQPAESPQPAPDGRPFREFLNALENTLVEVNELERMGGGLRDRMILVDTQSLADGEDEVRLYNALRLNYGKIRSLRASVKGNAGIEEVLTRNGHTLEELVAIDAKSEGAVILYYSD